MRKTSTTQSDATANNVIGWTVVGSCFLAAQFVGWVPVLIMLALAVVLLVAVAHMNVQLFDRAHDKSAQRCRRENEAARAELARTLREVSRLRAQADSRRPPQSVWGRN